MGSKQQLSLRPISNGGDGGFDGMAASRERSGLTNASFRVYYSLRAGAVPFLWESAPGTPKRSDAAADSPASPAKAAAAAPLSSAAGATLLPAISPPPSYQSFQLKGSRCRARSSWPAAAGGIVRALLGMLGLGKSNRRSRRRRASYL